MEESVTFFQGVKEIGKGGNVNVGRGGEAFDPRIEGGGEMDVESLVGAKGGIDARGEMGCGDLRVGLKIVGGIVGGAEDADAELREDAQRG